MQCLCDGRQGRARGCLTYDTISSNTKEGCIYRQPSFVFDAKNFATSFAALLSRWQQKKLRDKSKSSKNGSINLENYLVELDSTHVWKKSLLPLKVFVISESTEVRGEISALKVVTKDAATEWCEASNNKLSCIFVGNAADANILVEYTTDPSKVRKDHSMGVSGSTSVRLEKGTGEIVAAEMKILVLDSGQNLASARKNCLHEFGHALGLQGHSDNNKDLMFFISELKTVPTTLSKRDKETMKSLYRNY